MKITFKKLEPFLIWTTYMFPPITTSDAKFILSCTEDIHKHGKTTVVITSHSPGTGMPPMPPPFSISRD